MGEGWQKAPPNGFRSFAKLAGQRLPKWGVALSVKRAPMNPGPPAKLTGAGLHRDMQVRALTSSYCLLS